MTLRGTTEERLRLSHRRQDFNPALALSTSSLSNQSCQCIYEHDKKTSPARGVLFMQLVTMCYDRNHVQGLPAHTFAGPVISPLVVQSCGACFI